MPRRQFLLIQVPFILLIILGLWLYPKKGAKAFSDERLEMGHTVTIAMVGNNPRLVREKLTPFVEFINQFLEEEDIRLNAYVADSGAAIKRAIENGEVDFYLDAPYAVYDVIRTGKMQAIARQWRDAVPEYHSIIIARKNGPVMGIQDLNHDSIAFKNRGSSSSFYLPASILHEAGYALLGEGTSPGEVDFPHLHFLFSGGDQTSLQWLLENKVDLAAINSIIYDGLSVETKSQVKIVHESRKIPRHIVAARSNLQPDIEDNVLAVLMDMETSAEGRDVLRNFYNTRRFDMIPYESELRQQILKRLTAFPWEP